MYEKFFKKWFLLDRETGAGYMALTVLSGLWQWRYPYYFHILSIMFEQTIHDLSCTVLSEFHSIFAFFLLKWLINPYLSGIG